LGVAHVPPVDVSGAPASPGSTFDVSSRVRLSKSHADYLATREARRELPYEAMLAAERTWSVGERVHVYRTRDSARVADRDQDPRDYDVDHYVRILREQYATRFSRALTHEDFAAVFADPDQLDLFARSLAGARPVLTTYPLSES
jgi:hypothetical protein